ncbi:hypothetical protein [Lacrimispora sp.]|uniref:hypothetical protein n=1 Tax=Lacrimispora sp. TaxID=2719234 RepID=UPI00289C6B44|nr:hypothetical protein [Lacrimispora sp.]
MGLKTDYKDAMYDGQRRYRLIQNEDGTHTLVDATVYTQQGDKFGANDINATNKAINRLDHVTEIALTAAGWTGSTAPYTQTVSVAGITEKDRPTVSLYLPDGITAANVDLKEKAFDCVNRAVSGAGIITVYCYKKKPTTDFQIQVKGV